MPGFIDTHVHALDVASGEAAQPFVNLRSIKELQDWLRAEAPTAAARLLALDPADVSDAPAEHRFPTRQELDAAAPDHPVVVDCAYAFSLNTAACGRPESRATPPSLGRRDRQGRRRRADRPLEEHRRTAR